MTTEARKRKTSRLRQQPEVLIGAETELALGNPRAVPAITDTTGARLARECFCAREPGRSIVERV